MAEVCAKGLTCADALKPLVERYAQLPPEPSDDLYRDLGEAKPFSLSGR